MLSMNFFFRSQGCMDFKFFDFLPTFLKHSASRLHLMGLNTELCIFSPYIYKLFKGNPFVCVGRRFDKPKDKQSSGCHEKGTQKPGEQQCFGVLGVSGLGNIQRDVASSTSLTQSVTWLLQHSGIQIFRFGHWVDTSLGLALCISWSKIILQLLLPTFWFIRSQDGLI